VVNLIKAATPSNPVLPGAADAAATDDAAAGGIDFAQLFSLAVNGGDAPGVVNPLASSAAPAPVAEEKKTPAAAQDPLAMLAQMAGLPVMQPPPAATAATTAAVAGTVPGEGTEGTAAIGADGRLVFGLPGRNAKTDTAGTATLSATLQDVVGKDAGKDTGKNTGDGPTFRLGTDDLQANPRSLAAQSGSREPGLEALLSARTTQREAPVAEANGTSPAAAGLHGTQPSFTEVKTQAAAQAAIQSPLNSAQFAPELSAKVMVMAKDQLDMAQLQLNPKEMGPVTVQLSLNGTEATVAFAAAAPETRAAIEAALPVLKDMMLESGLNLAQTTVSDQTAQQQERFFQGQRGERGQGGQADGKAGLEAPVEVRTVNVAAPGRVDLYA
jgi:flagellar hook-length control protein FliK